MSQWRGHRYGGASFERHEARHFGLDAAAIAIIATTVVAAGVSAYGSYAASEASADAADYNKKIAENQAALASQQAEIDAENMHEKNKRLLALELTSQAGSGVDTSEGSPLLVRADTARQMARDEYLTRYGGAVRAGGYEQQAGLQGLYSKNYQQAANVGAGVSLLSSGAAIGGQTYYGRYGGYAYRDPYA
jgi:hypothetical protein